MFKSVSRGMLTKSILCVFVSTRPTTTVSVCPVYISSPARSTVYTPSCRSLSGAMPLSSTGVGVGDGVAAAALVSAPTVSADCWAVCRAAFFSSARSGACSQMKYAAIAAASSTAMTISAIISALPALCFF